MPRDTQQLAELVQQKHTVLTRLRDLVQAQQSLIQSGDVTTLMKVLAGKQQLISVLQTVEKQLDPYHGEDPESRCWETPEARTACARQADQCRALLDEIVTLEQTCEGQLRTRRDEAAEQLKSAHSAIAAHSAYTAPAAENTTQTGLLDLTSDK